MTDVHCLRTGVVRQRTGARGIGRYLWAGWREDALPVNAFLVEHAAGLCLFDAGQTARAAEPGYLPRWHPFLRLSRFELEPAHEIGAQLAALGFVPADVRWVVLSHLHTDHVGGLEPFRGAEILVGRTEWMRAQRIAGRLRGYVPQHWPDGAQPRLLDLRTDGFGPFPGSFDLALDGSLVIVATPGHTPGHASLLVRGVQRDVLLGGDLAHSKEDLREQAPAVARWCAENAVDYVGAHDWQANELLRTRGAPGREILAASPRAEER